jgi:hypothetical protein
LAAWFGPLNSALCLEKKGEHFMKNVVVLNLLFKPRPYSENDINTISQWIRFFQEHDLIVIATPPQERADVFDRITVQNKDFFIPFPVTSFDTCDRWKAGLLRAVQIDMIKPTGSKFYFLWSADFEFTVDSKAAAGELLSHNGQEDLVVGTIKASGTKNAIDRYGTGPLTKFWFPDEYRRMITGGFSKPRSELLRFSEAFLTKALNRRWYPTEQTICLIMQCFWDRLPIRMLQFSNLQDSDEARDNPNLVQQIERMEVWLKYMWRDREKNWNKTEYLLKCEESSRIATEACRLLLFP